jgi:integrase
LLLDYAGVDPNPARDRRLRLPRVESEIPQPPSRREVDLIILHAAPRMQLVLQVLAATGMRVGELVSLEWQDVDLAESRFRIRRGKTRAARRWVPVPSELMMEITMLTPPDDRVPERRVWQTSEKAVGSAMARACQSAGTAKYSPHDLRHRYISLLVKRGVPITEVSAAVGHAKSSITLDVYSHVLMDDDA